MLWPYHADGLQFVTSRDRFIDLGPYVARGRRSDFQLISLLSTATHVESLYINRRLSKNDRMVVAVEGPEATEVIARSIQEQWQETEESALNQPPSFLPDPFLSVFRDSACLGSSFEAWERQQRDRRICLGLRVSGRILGQWQPCNRHEVRQYDTYQAYLLNVGSGSQMEVCVATESNQISQEEDRFALKSDMSVVWWTSAGGNYITIEE